jgi:oligosaccharide repeat unit polymerase
MSWNTLYLLDAFAICTFILSYYRNCYRRGYRIDIWHSQLFLSIILPNMIMLPFCRSELNIPILGHDFTAVVAVLPKIFLICLLGYFSILVGGFVWRIRAGLGIRKLVVPVLDVVPRCSMMVMSSRSILIFQSFLCISLQMIVLGIYFSRSGFGFDLRSYTFANPALRPVALVVSNYSIIIASHCLARYIDKKEKLLLACTLFLSFGLVFFGARSNIASIYINVLLCYLMKLRTRVSLFKIVTIVSVILLAGLYLGNARAGQYSLTDFFTLLAAALFYGNNFSDLRDFAWVVALWDQKLWIGKTYLAALTAFVPRFVSEFRDTWGTGAATATTLGFDPHVHPGVRPGSFGEGYLNFGLIGVVVVGFLIGVILRRVDVEVKHALTGSHPSIRRAFSSTMTLSLAGIVAISANSSAFFVLIGIYIFSWVCLRLQRIFQPQPVSLARAN